MSCRLVARIPPTFAALALTTALGGCTASTVTWTTRAVSRPTPPMHLFVMAVDAEGSPATGNVGRDFRDVEQAVTARILAIGRERDPGATLAEVVDAGPYRPMDRYIAAMAPSHVRREELDAAEFARRHGGTHLLVPTIQDWHQMRTDDPVGAVVGSHNGVTITLRLVRLDAPTLESQVTFTNRSRVTLNQAPEHLLNDAFRKTVLQLLGG